MHKKFFQIYTFIILGMMTSCIHVTSTSNFGRLSKDGSDAKRDFVEDLTISKNLAANLKKSGIDSNKYCAQKVAYFNENSSEVFFEFHSKPCNGKLLDSPVLVAKWKFVSDKKKRFHMSQFTIDDRVVGASATSSDEVIELCSDASAKNCLFKRLESSDGKSDGKKGKIVAVLTES